MDNILSKDINLKYSDMDCNLILKPSVLLQILQDLASEHADGLDFGYKFVRSCNLAWYLLKYRMEFNNYPQNLFNIAVETEPRGYNKLFEFRDFKLYSNNTLFAKIASTWALVDLNTKAIANPSVILKDCKYMSPYVKREGDLSYSKIKIPDKFDKEKTFEIRFEDLDVNGHANNSNYIIWAFELLDFDFRKKFKLKNLDINFKKEISYNNIVSSGIKLENNISTHIIKNNSTNEDLCYIKAEWVNI